MLLVDYPRFERLPHNGTPRVGNEAVVHSTAGLVTLLEAALGGSAFTIGAGYQAPLTVPFGLAVTAAFGALGEADPLQDRWMVRSAAIDWQSGARGDDAITAQAIVERATGHDVFVAVTARGSESGSLLHASIRLVAMRGGRYAAIATTDLPPVAGSAFSPPDVVEPSRQVLHVDAGIPVRTEPPLLRLHPPRVLASGARTELAFEPDLLQLLMHPVAGHIEPLGRRVHPLGGVPLGAALTTALAAAGEGDPDRPVRTRIQRADATWFLPLPANAPWIARTRQNIKSGALGAVVDVIVAGARSAFTAGIEWTVA